jgi:hypothetical protein
MIKNWEDQLKQLNSSGNAKSFDTNINNKEDHINRGVEFILTGGKKKQPKTHRIGFEKIVNFFKKEVTIRFELSLGIRKKETRE